MECYDATVCIGFQNCQNLYKCLGIGLKSGTGISDTRGISDSKNLYYCTGYTTWQNRAGSICESEGVYNSVAIGLDMRGCNDVHYSRAIGSQYSYSTPKNSPILTSCSDTQEGGWNALIDPLEIKSVIALKIPPDTKVGKAKSASEKKKLIAPLKKNGIKTGADFASAEFQVSTTIQKPMNVVFENNESGEGGATIANENSGNVVFGSEDELPPGHNANVVLPPNVVFKGNKAGKSGSVIYNNGGTIVFSSGKAPVPMEIAKGSGVHLCYENLSEYSNGPGPFFLLRIVFEDGRTSYFTNSAAVAARNPSAVLMSAENGFFTAKIKEGGKLKEAIVDYGKRSKYFPFGQLNQGNEGKPLFSAVKFIAGE
jgi:hypothetical protein